MEKTFLEQVVDDVLATGVPLDKMAIILPSRRSITFFYRAMSERMKEPILPPKCLTLDDLIRTILPRSPIDPLTARLELYEAYVEVYPEPEPFEYFDAWSSAILKDFNTIDTYLIEASALYRDLRNLKEVDEEWSFMQEEWGSHQSDYNTFWKGLAPLYEQFHKRLEVTGRMALGHALKEVVQRKEQSILAEMSLIWMVGFNALSPAEIALLDLLHGSGRLRVLWDAAPFYLEDQDNTAGLFIRKWLHRPWHQKVFGPSDEKEVTNITYSAHPHGLAQCKFAGERVLELAQEEEQVAIVLADESLLPAMLQSIPEAIRAVNVTMGLSIQGQKAFQLTEFYMSMMMDAKRNAGLTERWTVHAHSVMRWMESAQETGLLDEEEVERIRKRLIAERWIRLDRIQLDELFPPNISELFYAMADEVEILGRLNRLLGQVKTINALDQGIKESMMDVLLTLEEKVRSYPFIHQLDLLWKFLRSAWLQEKTSFIGEPLEGVQIMGLLETRALDFKKVILVGANEGALPKARRFDTFIPALIRSHYGLPTQKEEDAVFAYYFYRLLQYPSHIHITYGSEKNDNGGGEMSRYLKQLVYGAPQAFGWKTELRAMNTPDHSSPSTLPELIVIRSPEISKAILNFFSSGVSVSRLNEFIRCPLDFYFKKILGLKEKETLEAEVASSELGNLVHNVLEDLFRERIGKGNLVKEDIRSMSKSYGERLTREIKAQGLEVMMQSGESALTKAMAFKMLGNFFERELQRIERDQIEVLGVEEEEEFTLDVEVGDVMVTVRFTAKIDRKDRVGNQVWILDYKTGKVDSRSLKLKSLDPEDLFDPDQSKSLQLLYYTWIFWRAKGIMAKAGIISMLGMETEPTTLSLEGRNVLEEVDLLTFEGRLKEKIIELYMTESFEHNEEHGLYCDYCPVPAERSY